MKNCEHCNSILTGKRKKRFCSKSCAALFNHTLGNFRKIKTCIICGDSHNRNKYCEKCYLDLRIKRDKIRSPKRREIKREYGHKLKRIFCHSKGGKCSVCGYNKCYRALVFHHKNPEDKITTLDSNSIIYKSIHKIYEELDKCILLCQNCHMELHSDD